MFLTMPFCKSPCLKGIPKVGNFSELIGVCDKDSMSLRKDFTKVAGSNLLLLLASTLNNFILPMILSVVDYANYKSYILYASFSGLFHLGFVDGINLKYGGQHVSQIDRNSFWSEHHLFFLFQTAITALLFVVAAASHSWVLMLFALSVMPINMQSFFLFFLQAVGEFGLYAKCVIIVPSLMCLFTCVAFAFHSLVDYSVFCLIYLTSYLISWLTLERRLRGRLPLVSSLKPFKQFRACKSIVFSGFFIMMGTIVFTFFMTAGRWLIKWLMDDASFAIYSIAASLLGFVLIFVNAVNKVFYPYLCRQKENETKKKLLIDMLLVIATLSLPFFFPMKVAIYFFLPNYINAVDIVKYLLLTLPAVIIIQSYYVNLYKVKKLERQYLKDGILYASISLVLNIMAFYFFRSLTSIAIAAVISSYIWFLFPNRRIHIVSRRLFLFLYLISVFGVFLSVETFVGNDMMAFLVSLFVITLINTIFYQPELKTIFSR